MARKWLLVLLTATAVSVTAQAADDEPEWTVGTPTMKSVGPLAFGPQGVLFVGDPEGAAIFALDTGDTEAPAGRGELDVDALDEKLAALLGTTVAEVRFHDLAVNPASGLAYLSVTRGGGANASPLLVRVGGPQQIEVLALDKARFLRADIRDTPAAGGTGRRNRRALSITDLAFHDGRLYVAGLSNEEFSSRLRVLDFPFEETPSGTGIKIYHASHGKWETASPVRSFVPMNIGGEPYLLCGYTCTPLVKFPVAALLPGEELVGTTIAELGNRNSPLDMIVYHRDKRTYLLVANTSRGVMKVSTEGIDSIPGLTEPVKQAAGLAYETIEALEDVTQLAALDEARAVILVQPKGGSVRLRTIDLP